MLNIILQFKVNTVNPSLDLDLIFVVVVVGIMQELIMVLLLKQNVISKRTSKQKCFHIKLKEAIYL